MSEFNKTPCPRCGKGLSDSDPCTCDDTRKIHVEVSMKEELKKSMEESFALKEQLKEKEANLIMAMEAAESNAAKAKELDDFKKAHPPSGKAPFDASKDGEKYESQVAMIDELYNRAYYKKEDYTPEQVKEAKGKISTLLESMVNGPSWKELGQKGAHEIMKHNLMECPECHATKIDVDICPKCGYDPTERRKIAKVRIYKGVKRED